MTPQRERTTAQHPRSIHRRLAREQGALRSSSDQIGSGEYSYVSASHGVISRRGSSEEFYKISLARHWTSEEFHLMMQAILQHVHVHAHVSKHSVSKHLSTRSTTLYNISWFCTIVWKQVPHLRHVMQIWCCRERRKERKNVAYGSCERI